MLTESEQISENKPSGETESTHAGAGEAQLGLIAEVNRCVSLSAADQTALTRNQEKVWNQHTKQAVLQSFGGEE